MTLDGKQWTAASLTLTEVGGKSNVVLTLFLIGEIDRTQFYSDGSNTRGNNVYSRSIIRNVLLENNTWALFQDKGSNSFAQQYLVQPKNIQYQRTESHYGRENSTLGGNYQIVNDSLLEQTTGWDAFFGSNHYKPSETFTDPNEKTVRYDAWGDDYIWLPSCTETGFNDYLQTSSIWQLTNAQRAHTPVMADYTWFRGTDWNHHNVGILMDKDGAADYTTSVASSYGIRPAIHLNLSAAEASLQNIGIENPQNISSTYSGNVQTVKSVVDAKPTENTWYDSEWYEHTGNYVNLTYQDSQGADVTNVKNAGTYWVKAEITENWINAVNAEVDSESSKWGWTATQITTAKANRSPKFKGTADTSDFAHVESDTVRWFKFTVNKKEITVNKPVYNASTGTLSPPTYADMTELYADVPVLGVRITGDASDLTKYDAIDTLPTKRGTYVARAVFIKSATDKTETETNYTIKDANNCKCDIVLGFSRLPIVGVANATAAYTGSEITFPLSGYSSTWANTAGLTLPTGVTLKGSDSEGWSLGIEDAGEYTITATLKSDKVADWCWDVADKTQTPQTPQTFKVTVTKKTITVTFTSTANNGAFVFAAGDSVTLGAEANGIVDGDNVKISLSYVNKSNPTSVIDVSTGTLDASTLAMGSYTLTASIKDSAATDNKNYVLSGLVTQDFNVTGKGITISGVTWQYVQDAEPTVISGNSVVLTYNGKEFTFTVKETAEELHAKGVKIDSYTNNVQKNATNGAITVKVKLVPYDESFEFSDPTQTEVEFSLTVTINKIELKLSDFKWSAEPTNELEYTGNTQTVTIVSGLPSFLQVVYHGNSGLSVGPYTTTILSITVKNDADSVEMSKNYTSFEPEDYADYKYEWSITKKKIVANWTNAEHTTTDGKKITIPKVSGVEDGILEYSYTKFPSGEAITLAEILASYTETEISVYNVTVKIADGKTDSYMLLNSKNEVKDEVTQRFSVGDDKKAVTVSLIETKVYFNNQPQAVKLNYTGEGITMGDFAVEYVLINADGSEGEATNTAPTAVGKYKVTVTLQGEKANTHIIIGENVFEYVIAHKDRFILTEAAAASHGYKFVYETFSEYEQDIKEYLYSAENAESVVYIAYLAYADTIADLLKQFVNAEDITAYTADNTLIDDLTTMLATGMMLRIMDGETILNQLTISVMGDIDGDGDIGTADKARLNSYTLDNLPLTGAYLLACDLDGDGEVGTADKARLNAYTLDTLDIYAGLTLRATAQTSSVETLANADESAFVECNTAQTSSVGTSAITAEPVFATSEYADKSATTYAASAAKEYVDECEIVNAIAMTDNAVLLLSDETTYIGITDIKNIAFATSIYADCKQRV